MHCLLRFFHCRDGVGSQSAFVACYSKCLEAGARVVSGVHACWWAGRQAGCQQSRWGRIRSASVNPMFLLTYPPPHLSLVCRALVPLPSASYGAYTYSQAEHDAIDTLRQAGVIFVAAAGNGEPWATACH